MKQRDGVPVPKVREGEKDQILTQQVLHPKATHHPASLGCCSISLLSEDPVICCVCEGVLGAVSA